MNSIDLMLNSIARRKETTGELSNKQQDLGKKSLNSWNHSKRQIMDLLLSAAKDGLAVIPNSPVLGRAPTSKVQAEFWEGGNLWE